ncbi:MAG: Gfo/Idh/MocA family oxidoreductase [Chlorobi bacterium]|nr:Gfo/Idh/MocA family oxidoreductase [Chlorobiota bacterium]
MERKLKIHAPRVKKIRWGVAGCGGFAENSFLPTLQQLKRSRLVSVYSHDLNRAENLAGKFGAEKGYDDFSEFLKSDFDALYIGSVNADHHWQTIEAAKAGKHIHCEKPLALNSKQAEDMVKVCEKNKVFLSVNYTHRFHPLVSKAREFIIDGMIGRIVNINASFNIDYAPCNNYRFQKEKSGGGALRDLGTHMLDMLRYFGGTITDINGFIDNVIYTSEVDDFASGLVKFKKSGYGYFNVSYNVKEPLNRIEILGYKGTLVLENIIGSHQKAGKLIIKINGQKQFAFRKKSNKLLFALRHLQKSYLENTPPENSGKDGLENMKLMEELEKKCR